RNVFPIGISCNSHSKWHVWSNWSILFHPTFGCTNKKSSKSKKNHKEQLKIPYRISHRRFQSKDAIPNKAPNVWPHKSVQHPVHHHHEEWQKFYANSDDKHLLQ